MIKDDLSGLSVLLLVAEKRSFTAAAAELRVTPSAISQTISALEQRLGVRLLQRTTRNVGVTEAGARLLARLKPAMAEVRASFEALDELRDRPAGTLRLNVPHIGSKYVLEPILAAFLAAYPEIRIDVAAEDGFVDIVAEGFDAGIRLGETVDRGMIGVRISEDHRVAVVGSPAYFSVRGKPKHPRDLVAHECINYRARSSGQVYRWEFTEKGKDFDIAVDGRLVCNEVDLMVRAAVDGIGLAHAIEATVRTEIDDGRLVRVLDAFCPPFPGFFLYYPSRAHIPPKLRVFIDFLRARVPKSRRAK
jgi:DNA-binding transcriptional LysR family regulator